MFVQTFFHVVAFMDSPYALKYYRSYKRSESYLSTYSCILKDGGLLIAQAAENIVECIIYNNDTKMIKSLSIPSKVSGNSLNTRR